MRLSPNRFVFFVISVVALATLALVLAWQTRGPFPGWWALSVFIATGAALDSIGTRLRIGAKGSVSFVLLFASVLLFGAFWGAVIGCGFVLVGQIGRLAPVKLAFNVAQTALSLSVAVGVYAAVGGSLPPSYLHPHASLSASGVQQDLARFLVLAITYFVLNQVTVSAAVALKYDRAFREIWNVNARGVLGYDLVASLLAVAMAALYTRFDQWAGSGVVAVVLLLLPIAIVRHVYGLYRQLQESGQELLRVMVKAIEARDPYTSGHSLRVSTLSRTIALELGLPATQVEQIETAALLHDVGKIHEEFAPLLRKASRLTDEETALMQTHAIRSAELVAMISKFHGVVEDAVRHHHERWDGKGYPDGLAGEAIPIGARIILVADTIDAMTTDRPYRARLSVDAVLRELERYKGTQFDPRVIECVTTSAAVRRLMAYPAGPHPITSPSELSVDVVAGAPRRA